MRNIFLGLFLILISSSVLARPVLHCLREEEAAMMKNGVSYRGFFELNQKLQSTLLDFKGEVFQRITRQAVCSKNTTYPSLKLLEHIVQYKSSAFKHYWGNRKIWADEFLNDVPELLIEFTSFMELSCPIIGFYEKKIKGLKEFKEQLLYLREDFSGKWMLRINQSSALKMIQAFEQVEIYSNECKKEVQKKKAKKEQLRDPDQASLSNH